MKLVKNPSVNKTKLAKELGISRSSLYYKPKREQIDLEIKSQIESVMIDNPSYGHKRIAIALKLNKKRIRRVMKKYGLKPYRSRYKPPKPEDENKPETIYPNLIKTICPIRPNIIWASDFTYIKYKGRFIYLATIIDIYTREIIGWNISRFHNKYLVLGALKDALEKTNSLPIYLHSDQGSEYDSEDYTKYAESLGIQISMSKKSSPWENGFQESYYSNFKVDLKDPESFDTLGELIEAINQTIFYYNTERIHGKLKMSPKSFRNFRMKVIESCVLV